MFYRNRFRMTFLASLVLCLGVLSSCSDNGDEARQPGVFTWSVQRQPQGWHDLWGVSALDTTHVWAVSRGGTNLFYDGSSWTAQTSGATDTLRDVSALDESHVWAVGDGGTIFFYDGTSWTAQASGTTYTLRGVSALDESHVWAVGVGGTILFYDGTSWTAQASGTTDTLLGVSALDETHVWAVGAGESILFATKTWSQEVFRDCRSFYWIRGSVTFPPA